MRFSKLILGVVSVGAATAVAVAGCGSSSGVTGASSTTSGTTTATGGSTASGGFPCSPKASCPEADSACIGLVSNKGQTTFGLRMSELDVISPTALTTGIIKTVVGGAVGINLPSCNLSGTGTFSWLLEFDTTAGTLKTGGAKPVADPTQGYSFDDEMIQGLHVQPVTFTGITPDANGNFSVTTGTDLIVPIFLNNAGTSSVLLPLHQARLTMGVLSSNNDCIGTYNASTLETSNSCNPTGTMTQFTDAASLDGYITLEEADNVLISAINQSLCVILSGNASMYGVTSADAGGATVCKRDSNGNILFQGGWCAETNSAAGPYDGGTCADAEQLKGNFAASSVKINN